MMNEVNGSAGFSDEMLEITLLALEALKHSLRDWGLDLLIKFGDAESVLRELVVEVRIRFF